MVRKKLTMRDRFNKILENTTLREIKLLSGASVVPFIALLALVVFEIILIVGNVWTIVRFGDYNFAQVSTLPIISMLCNIAFMSHMHSLKETKNVSQMTGITRYVEVIGAGNLYKNFLFVFMLTSNLVLGYLNYGTYTWTKLRVEVYRETFEELKSNIEKENTKNYINGVKKPKKERRRIDKKSIKDWEKKLVELEEKSGFNEIRIEHGDQYAFEQLIIGYLVQLLSILLDLSFGAAIAYQTGRGQLSLPTYGALEEMNKTPGEKLEDKTKDLEEAIERLEEEKRKGLETITNLNEDVNVSSKKLLMLKAELDKYLKLISEAEKKIKENKSESDSSTKEDDNKVKTKKDADKVKTKKELDNELIVKFYDIYKGFEKEGAKKLRNVVDYYAQIIVDVSRIIDLPSSKGSLGASLMASATAEKSDGIIDPSKHIGALLLRFGNDLVPTWNLIREELNLPPISEHEKIETKDLVSVFLNKNTDVNVNKWKKDKDLTEKIGDFMLKFKNMMTS